MTPVGIGWRHRHYAQLLEERAPLDFIEVHSENFFGQGGAALDVLRQARAVYPVSLHGVGLALGSALGVDDWHLERLARLVDMIEPARVSDHACFARAAIAPASGTAARHAHAADLLPIPFNPAALDVMCANVQRVQERLKRPLLVENLSAYLHWQGADTAETEFLTELSRRTGCGLLLDVNNIYVNALNAQIAQRASLACSSSAATDPLAACIGWLDRIAPALVGEIHLAGHCHVDGEHGEIVIDDHGSRVCPEVWQLFRHAQSRFNGTATLIEWDTDVPALEVLLDEAHRAREIAGQCIYASPPIAKRSQDIWQAGPGSGTAPAAPAQAPVPAMTLLMQQQQALVAVLLAPQDGAAQALLASHTRSDQSTARRGLLAYLANGAELAQRSLAAAYPVLAQLVGSEAFNAMTRDFWRHDPPQRGDLAQWGSALAAYVQSIAGLAEEPYLSDVARVEWALHSAATAPDAQLDLLSLRLLVEHEPGELALGLCPGAACVCSAWPIASILNAHLVQMPSLQDAGRKLRAGHGETTLVWRKGFAPRMREASPGESAFVETVLAGDSLAEALDGAPGFDFSAWLPEAVQDGLLIAVRLR